MCQCTIHGPTLYGDLEKRCFKDGNMIKISDFEFYPKLHLILELDDCCSKWLCAYPRTQVAFLSSQVAWVCGYYVAKLWSFCDVFVTAGNSSE